MKKILITLSLFASVAYSQCDSTIEQINLHSVTGCEVVILSPEKYGQYYFYKKEYQKLKNHVPIKDSLNRVIRLQYELMLEIEADKNKKKTAEIARLQTDLDNANYWRRSNKYIAWVAILTSIAIVSTK